MTLPAIIQPPELDIVIPEGSVDWAYKQYSGLMLNLIEAQAENLESEMDTLWSCYDLEQAAIWREGFDVVGAMGHHNPLLTLLRKTLRYEESVNDRYRRNLREAHRLRDMRLLIQTRLSIEKQRQTQYAEQKAVELVFVKEVLNKMVASHNLAVKAYEAHVQAVKTYTEGWNKVVDAYNDLQIKEAQKVAETYRIELELTRADAAYQRSMVRVQQALYEVAMADIDVQKAELRAENARIQALRIQIESTIKASEVVVEKARQKDILADIAIIGAQKDEIRAYLAEVDEVYRQINIVRSTAAYKLGALNGVLGEKQNIIGTLQAAQQEQLKAQTQYVTAEVAAAKAETEVFSSDAEKDLSIVRARGEAEMIDIAADAQSRSIEGMKQVAIERLGVELEMQRYFTTAEIDKAKAKVADILSHAKIVNNFTENRYSS